MCRFVFLATLFRFVLALLVRCALANWNANPFFLSPITVTVTQCRTRTVICHQIQDIYVYMYVYVCMQCALKVIPTMEQAYLSIKKIFLLHCRIAALLLLVQLPVLSAYLAWPNNCLLTMFLFFCLCFCNSTTNATNIFATWSDL